MNNKLQKNITLRYAIALSLIAFLSVFAYLALRMSIQSSESLAYIVNISGKQRMLSQHIALDVNRLYNSKLDGCDKVKCQSIKNFILKNSKIMIEANEELSTGKFVSYENSELSDEIFHLYHGSSDVSNRVKEYTTFALQAAQTESIEELKKILDEISLRSEPLLIDLNRIVMQYQKEGEESIALIKNVETAIVIFTLFVLLLEVLFIFQPMVRFILKLSNEKNNILDQLQEQVDLKTKDLTEVNEKLKKLAFYDPLTALRNRLTLEKDVEELIVSKNDFCMFMIDVDYFKDLNDTYGHDFGDHVLKVLAKIFKNTFRGNDNIYRVGGEEFVVILKNISYDDSVKIANKCRVNVKDHSFHIENKTFHKTISIGLYHSSQADCKSFKQIYSYIDATLYEAKNNGRNRVEVFSPQNGHSSHVDDIQKPIVMKFKSEDYNSIVSVSENILEILNYTKEELENGLVKFYDILHEDDRDMFKNISLQSFTARVISAQNRVKIFRVNVIKDDNEIVLHLYEAISLGHSVGNSTIISNFYAMMQDSDDYIYFKDKNHLFTAASKSLVDLTNVDSRDQFIGKTDYEVFPKEYADVYYKLEKDVFHKNIAIAHDVQPFEDNDGRKGVVDNKKYPIKNSDGEIIGLFGMARVIVDKE